MLIAGSLSIAWLNWSRDPAQRSGKHVAIWLMRAVAAGIWYQGSIWKLPLSVIDAFMHWTSQLALYTAIPLHATIVKSIVLTGIAVIKPRAYRTEVFLTVSLLLGIAVRLAGVVAVLFTPHLWIGLCNDPTEWPWTYVAIICAHGMFDATEAGHSLGLDNLLRGQWSGVFEPPAAAPGLPRRLLIARSRGRGPHRTCAARATAVTCTSRTMMERAAHPIRAPGRGGSVRRPHG